MPSVVDNALCVSEYDLLLLMLLLSASSETLEFPIDHMTSQCCWHCVDVKYMQRYMCAIDKLDTSYAEHNKHCIYMPLH